MKLFIVTIGENLIIQCESAYIVVQNQLFCPNKVGNAFEEIRLIDHRINLASNTIRPQLKVFEGPLFKAACNIEGKLNGTKRSLSFLRQKVVKRNNNVGLGVRLQVQLRHNQDLMVQKLICLPLFQFRERQRLWVSIVEKPLQSLVLHKNADYILQVLFHRSEG